MHHKNKKLDKQIKVLHIGYGFIPWRGGGLIEYAEDLMEEQVKDGYEVYYFCSGRHYPFLKKTFLKKWKSHKGYLVFEVINPPIYHGGDKGTWFDLESKVIENLFKKVLLEIKPDIIHIQELAGLPSSLILIAKRLNIPCVMTLHDYFLLCPTLKLFDYNHNLCEDFLGGQKCVKCCSLIPLEIRKMLIHSTLIFQINKTPFLYRMLKKGYKKLKPLIYSLLKRNSLQDDTSFTFFNKATEKANYFLERRTKNIERLKLIDLLIAQSYKVEEIYRRFLGNNINIKTIHSSVKHLDKIRPELLTNIAYPIKFVTLNGFASIPKGAYLLLETLEKLENLRLTEKFEFHILGGVDSKFINRISKFKNVIYHGSYKVDDLDKLLSGFHVGIMPSVWWECYGYTGVEMLTKGIPVIGNARGGIVDYVSNGFTGWLNKSASSDELVEIIKNILNNPQQIIELNRKIIENRNTIVKTMHQHLEEISEIYLDILKAKLNRRKENV